MLNKRITDSAEVSREHRRGADLRWAKDQHRHASIEETEGTHGHLERERHERRVNLDSAFGSVRASTGVHAIRRRWGK